MSAVVGWEEITEQTWRYTDFVPKSRAFRNPVRAARFVAELNRGDHGDVRNVTLSVPSEGGES